MAKGLMKVYSDLPSWAKGVVVVGGLAVTYLALTKGLQALKASKLKKEALAEINNATDELNQAINQGIKPTLQNSALQAISEGIVKASNGCGSDENIIFAQFDKIKNEADILSLVKVFGLRKKSRCPFSDDEMEDFWSSYTPAMSLTAMVNSELSSTEIRQLNDKLSAKGINFKF